MTVIKTVFPFEEGSALKPREITRGMDQAHRIYESECSVTLKALGGGVGALSGLYRTGVSFTESIRRLTPTECERLQGFPDGWTEGVSDTQRAKQCCNAVTTNVVRDVAERLYA